MLPEILREEKEILKAVTYLPSVSLILPFEPKMAVKWELEYRLQRMLEKAERELLDNYPAEKTLPVLDKLKALVKLLDYATYKKSIAILASPLIAKVYYLDIAVEEKLIIDESFEIRDLVYSKKEIHKYLILVLSSIRSRIFLGNTTQFVRISFNTPSHVAAYKNDVPEKTGNFSDPSYRKEVLLDKFLHHIDTGLGHILNAYQLPLFIMGTERTMGHFRKITHNAHRITGWVHGNYEEATETEIRQAIAPHVADWKKVIQGELLQRIDAALSAKKLAIGIRDVWHAAMNNNGRMLVVEKNYTYAARKEEGERIFSQQSIPNNPLYIKDAVDDVIEKVLQQGGDVSFVDEGLLDPYQHIALIEYY